MKKANVAEYLDNVLPPDLKKCVLPLVETKPRLPAGELDRDEALQRLLNSPELAIRECVASAIARHGWTHPAIRKLAG